MRTKAVVYTVVVIAAAGCASRTAFTSTWRNPETKPVSLAGEKIVALVISPHETTRRTAEDTLAAQITTGGAQGVPAWSILPTADVKDEEKARAAIAKTGAAAVVTMEVVAQSREFSPANVQLRWRSPSHRSFWPHYRWAWQMAWSPPPPPRTNIWVETLVYTLEPDELIWGGRSRTTDAASTAALFAEVANAAARQFAGAGLLKGSDNSDE
jgi:hypothetical protein